MWLAGGGIKGGISHGKTDELGYAAVEDKVHVNDLHATMLHLFGIDHLNLTYRFQGRDFRLTDLYGRVVSDLAMCGCEGVILGCTEIGLLVHAHDAAVPLFDTAEIHATNAALYALGVGRALA